MTIPATEALAKRSVKEDEARTRAAALAAESGANTITKAFAKGKAAGGKGKGKANASEAQAEELLAPNGHSNGSTSREATDSGNASRSVNGAGTPASDGMSADRNGSSTVSVDMDTT